MIKTLIIAYFAVSLALTAISLVASYACHKIARENGYKRKATSKKSIIARVFALVLMFLRMCVPVMRFLVVLVAMNAVVYGIDSDSTFSNDFWDSFLTYYIKEEC